MVSRNSVEISVCPCLNDHQNKKILGKYVYKRTKLKN